MRNGYDGASRRVAGSAGVGVSTGRVHVRCTLRVAGVRVDRRRRGVVQLLLCLAVGGRVRLLLVLGAGARSPKNTSEGPGSVYGLARVLRDRDGRLDGRLDRQARSVEMVHDSIRKLAGRVRRIGVG